MCCYIALPENVSTLYSQTLIYEFHSFPIFDNLKDKSCILFYFASLIEWSRKIYSFWLFQWNWSESTTVIDIDQYIYTVMKRNFSQMATRICFQILLSPRNWQTLLLWWRPQPLPVFSRILTSESSVPETKFASSLKTLQHKWKI